jgi:hypothetical protein
MTRNTLKRRFSGHRKDASRHPDRKMSKALNEYKEVSNWKIELIEDNIFQKDIFTKEKYYIKLYNTFENGYNSNDGNNGNPPGKYKFSEEQKKHLSEVNKGKKPSEYCIQRVREVNSKRIPSEKQKLIASKTGKEFGAKLFKNRKEIHRQEMLGHEFNAEIWKLTNKDGTVLEISNLKKWCRENSQYKACSFYNMLRGALKSYKGWVKVEKLTNKYSKKELV